MRNLKLHSHIWLAYPELGLVDHFLVPEYDAHEIYVCHNLKVSRINTTNHEISLLLDMSNEIPTEGIKVINILYLSIQRSILLALNTGDLLILNIDTLQVVVPDLNFFIHDGIKAADVSPDQDLITVVTNDLSVVLLDCTLEQVNIVDLKDKSFGDGEFITVGWGKKETQFHGSEGKNAAKAKVVLHNTELALDDNLATITWRGDGSLFAVGFCSNSTHIFKVFDREGVLKFTSETHPGLECNFTWRPSGNLIATTQQCPNKYVVAFFEKNGLKHGELVLPFLRSKKYVKKLSWSSDSDILCVWCVDLSTNQSSVLMYTVNNYHWYLKQSLPFPIDTKLSALFWDDGSTPGKGKSLYMFLEGGIYTCYNWRWGVDKSNGKTSQDNALVGVIDGNKVLITAFRQGVVPPPMSSYFIQCEKNVNGVIFGPINSNNDECRESDDWGQFINSNSICTVLDDGSVSMYTIRDYKSHDLIGSGCFDVKDIVLPLQMHHLLWLSTYSLLCVSSRNEVSECNVVNVTMGNKISLETRNSISLHENVIGIVALPSKFEALLQCSSGKLLNYVSGDTVKEYNASFPEVCHQFEATIIGGEFFVFGLTPRNRFYIDDKEVANNVNSFFVHSDFLMLTTIQHQLLSYNLTKDVINDFRNSRNTVRNKTMAVSDQSNLTVSNRKLERGSHLITVVSCDTRTVLQLPRGNLEVIQPRALSVKIIGKYLDNCKYYEAFDLIRKQRINSNLIYDHNRNKFIQSIDKFIADIKNSSWICLFISELDNEDVTKTMYLSSYMDSVEKESSKSIQNKVKVVCDEMRMALIKFNDFDKHALPILTTYVKSGEMADIEKALLEVKNLKQKEISLNRKGAISSDEALKYLLNLVNVNKLYDVALGLYDFELVMHVAHHSQKDPKEYVPYLNSLKTMEDNYQRYTIDKQLKRFESAVKHLIACGKDKQFELLEFVKQHCLFGFVLRALDSHDERYQRCALEYADYLMIRKHYSEAGNMYRRCNNLNKALDAFIEAADWQSAMHMVQQLGMTDTEAETIRRKIYGHLTEIKRYSDALSLLEYCGSTTVEELVSCALEGRLYKTSLSICHKHQRNDLIESVLQPAVLDQYTSTSSLISQSSEQFINQKQRLSVVKQNKLLKSLNAENNEDIAGDCDLFSDTSSVRSSTGTRSSGRTFRSSKNRRKHERKLVSLKEGSRFEDVALVRALHVLVTSTFDMRGEVSEVNHVLQWLGKDDLVMQLQTSLDSLLKMMVKSFPEIWNDDLVIDASKSASDLNTLTDSQDQINNEAASSLEPHIRIAPVIQDFKWKLELL